MNDRQIPRHNRIGSSYRDQFVSPERIRHRYGFNDDEMRELMTLFARRGIGRHIEYGFEAQRAMKLADDYSRGEE